MENNNSSEHSRKRKAAIFWGKFIKILTIKFIVVCTLVLFLLFFTVSFAEAPIHALIAQINKPKPITQSSQTLPADIQKTIENLARQEIKEEQAVANLPVNISINSTLGESKESSIQPLIDAFTAITGSPVDKAEVRISKVDRLIKELVNLLTKDKSDLAVNKAVNIIQDIGRETDAVVMDRNVQANRDVLRLLIEQYNRLQLIIQQLEDKLPTKAYLEIEDARQKYLVVTATASINAAPNLDAVHNIALKEVERVVGKDFAQIKAIEIISDFEAGLSSLARQKLIALEKQLALEFEKNMLKLPKDVRNRRLANFINYSFGNPLNQAESFEKMKSFVNDREIILGLDSLKTLALKRLEDRIFEIDSQDLQNKFLELSLKRPEDLKVLAQLQLDVLASNDQNKIKKIVDLKTVSLKKIVELFGNKKTLDEYFGGDSIKNADLLEVSVVSQLSDILNNSDIKNIKKKTLQSFAANIRKANFQTHERSTYNAVSENADVRLLFPNPQAVLLLENIKSQLDLKDRPVIAIAQKSIANLISQNPKVLIKDDRQKLYEKVQQITQSIFTAENQTNLEKDLPPEIRKEISLLRKTLGKRNIPKIATPTGVILPRIAKLSDNVEQAIILAAKARIKDKEKSQEAKLDLTVSAKDLGVSTPIILPDSPLYKIKSIIRLLQLAITFDPLAKAELLIQQDNQKTLEAAELIRENSSLIAVNKSLGVLKEIEDDFARLKSHANDLAKLKKENPQKVDSLIDRIIANGLARQTVFSAIEDKVYGEDFVRVEKIRTGVLKNGIDTLLKLSDGDAGILVTKLEQAVNKSTGSKFKELKAIELLVEIKRFQPEKIGLVIAASQTKLIKKFEAKILEIKQKERNAELLSYVDSFSGNPVRQFEALDSLKKDFTNPSTKLLAEALKDAAIENLTDRIAEITDASIQKEFVDAIVGNRPEDLKIILDIELRKETPQILGLPQTDIEQKIGDIKSVIEENIVDTYKDDAEALAQTDFIEETIKTPDIIDVKVAQELSDIFSRTPEVSSEVINLVQKTENTIVNEFGNAVAQIPTTPLEAIDVLVPVPQVLAELVELKEEAKTASDKAEIDLAIKEELKLIEEHLAQVADPSTVQATIDQLTTDPVIIKIIEEVGGKDLVQTIEDKAQEVEVVAVSNNSALQTTVNQIEQEIFQAPVNNPSTVEQTLPQAVQEEIQTVKQVVPVEQIPQVNVSVQVTEPQAPVSVPTSVPTSVPVGQPTSAPAAPAAPQAPAVQAPVQESAPAPAVPGL